MPRTSSSNIRKFFTCNINADSSKCNIAECEVVLKGTHAANLERLVKRQHKEVDKEYCEERAEESAKKRCTESGDSVSTTARQTTLDESLLKTVRVKIDIAMLNAACVELVTVNGRPFRLIEDSGFRKILDPLLQGLGNKACINVENIHEGVTTLANSIRNDIKTDIQNKFISLKIDSATRLNRSILGVNAQYIKDGKPILRTLAMKEMTYRHTSEYIKACVLGVLESYEVSLDQVFSITSDNGANIIKSITLLSNAQQELTVQSNTDQPSTSACNSPPTIFTLHDDDSDDESNNNAEFKADSILFNVEIVLDSLLDSGSTCGILRGVRCAAHTLQLAVADALKETSCKEGIDKARSVCKRLRTPSIMTILKRLGQKKPVIDCPTRWHSTCDMLLRLLGLKCFCEDMAASNPALYVSPSQWTLF